MQKITYKLPKNIRHHEITHGMKLEHKSEAHNYIAFLQRTQRGDQKKNGIFAICGKDYPCRHWSLWVLKSVAKSLHILMMENNIQASKRNRAINN